MRLSPYIWNSSNQPSRFYFPILREPTTEQNQKENNLHKTRETEGFSLLNDINYLHKNRATWPDIYNGIHIGKHQHLWEDPLYFQTNVEDDYCGDTVEIQHRLTATEWINDCKPTDWIVLRFTMAQRLILNLHWMNSGCPVWFGPTTFWLYWV